MSDIREAIEHGIQAAQKELEAEALLNAPRELERKGRLTFAYNRASGLIAGLNLLKEMPNSTFDFSVSENNAGLCIGTNIPTHKYTVGARTEERTLDIYIGNDISAYGDIVCDPYTEVGGVKTECITGEHGDPDKVLEFVATKAVLKGLLKP